MGTDPYQLFNFFDRREIRRGVGDPRGPGEHRDACYTGADMPTRLTLTAGSKPVVIGKRGKWFTLPRGRKVQIRAPSGAVRLKAGASQTFVLEPDIPPRPTGPIHSNFLWTKWRHMCLHVAYPFAQQDVRMDGYFAEGYDDIDLGCMNEGDNPFGQSYYKIDAVKNRAPLQHALVGTKRRGKRATAWLLLNDWKGAMPIDRAIDAAKSIMPWADPYVARWIPALEWMETWSSADFRTLVDVMRGLTQKPIYLHCLDEHLGGSTWPVQGIYVQYALNTDAHVRDLTKRAKAKWGVKHVIAAEFENPTALEESRRLSKIAIAAGASGTAQG